MIFIPGFQIIRQLYCDHLVTIYKGYRIVDHRIVIVKFLNRENPDEDQLTRFQKEYEFMKLLDQDGVIKVDGLYKINSSLAIVFEDSDDMDFYGTMKNEMDHSGKTAWTEYYPGIDLQSAISLLEGNTDLLVSLYEQFIKLYSGCLKDLTMCLDQGDLDTAKRMVHTIKGVAGNISATNLFNVAEKFQMQLEKNGTMDSEMLFHFDDALRQALESAERICHEFKKKTWSKL